MRLIILDRDGVINEDSDAYIKSPDEWRAIPGSLEAIAQLCKHQYHIAIATNQSGLGRGYFNMQTLKAIHEKMLKQLQTHAGHIDFIAFCPHIPEDDCNCRKPKPGLFHQIEKHFSQPLTHVPVIGDSLGDCQAANSVGATPILVKTGKGQRTLTNNPNLAKEIKVYDDLSSAVTYLLQQAS